MFLPQKYNLKSRGNLHMTKRYQNEQKQLNKATIDKLKRKRSGKHFTITAKSLNQVNQLRIANKQSITI